MADQHLWRATYDADQVRYIVEDAGWINGSPAIQYRFAVGRDRETNTLLGMFSKLSLDEDGRQTEEVYPFGMYADKAAFNAEVAAIQQEGRTLSVEENLDAFLAITDVVKARAYANGLDDEGIFSFEGLFQSGPEDAYTLRQFSGSERLHDHVERSTDECWRIHLVPVADPDGKHQGWGVFALHYPYLSFDAPKEAITATTRAERLDLDHRLDKASAFFSARSMMHFLLAGDRVKDPMFAYMDDSLVLECVSVQCSIEKVARPVWETLEGGALHAFRNETQPVVRELAHWHPVAADGIEAFAQATGLQIHQVDQIHARLLSELGLHDKFGEDSPWRMLDEG